MHKIPTILTLVNFFYVKIMHKIPTILTLINLFCGCVAVVSLLNYKKYFIAALMVMISIIADFLDGFIARILRSKNLIGKYLDSLSDLISFGLVPAIFVFLIIEDNFYFKKNILYFLFPWVAFLITMFSALRLAIFNTYNDDYKLSGFKGLNTTANTIFFISLKFITPHDIGYNIIFKLITNPISILTMIIISCMLLISKIPMFSFKINTLSWDRNKYRYYFFIISTIFIIFLGKISVTCIVVLYIIFSIIGNFFTQKRIII